MGKRDSSPLTEEQKDLLRSKFVKLCPLKNACTYCSKIVSSDHIARWASHFRACKKVCEPDKRAYYALGTDPMPASKRKAFSQPIAQVCNDMMGIELVLHASLLHTMRENQKTTVGTKTTENAVTVQLEAHDRAEELAANNFSHPHDFSAHDTENFVDGSVSSTLPCTIVGIVNDSVATDTDEIEDILEAKRLKTEVAEDSSTEGVSSDSPDSEARTDQEDLYTVSADGSSTHQLERTHDSSSDFMDMIKHLKKAPLSPAQDC